MSRDFDFMNNEGNKGIRERPTKLIQTISSIVFLINLTIFITKY